MKSDQPIGGHLALATVSGVLFLAGLALFLFVDALDAEARRG